MQNINPFHVLNQRQVPHVHLKLINSTICLHKWSKLSFTSASASSSPQMTPQIGIHYHIILDSFYPRFAQKFQQIFFMHEMSNHQASMSPYTHEQVPIPDPWLKYSIIKEQGSNSVPSRGCCSCWEIRSPATLQGSWQMTGELMKASAQAITSALHFYLEMLFVLYRQVLTGLQICSSFAKLKWGFTTRQMPTSESPNVTALNLQLIRY